MATVGYGQVNLASDLPGLAAVTVPSLVNPWGVSFSPTGPFWFADNGTGVSDLLDGRGQVVPLIVMVPPAGASGSSPTGTVFNGGPGFAISANGVTRPSRFLFAAEDGTISGWTTAVDPTAAVLAVDNSSLGADYTGLALATNGAGQSFLYAADFGRGAIDVFDQAFKAVQRAGAFQDPNLPAGFAPFNIQNVDGRLFVAYAQQDADDPGEELDGAGLGFIDVYDTDGVLLSRFASQGALNAPGGIALAPADFGPFGGALLVGNNGDGHVNAYDPVSGAFLGQLAHDNGAPIAIPDLWALTFGNGHEGGNAQTLFFAAGVDYEAHGLFGAIQPPQLRGADTAGTGVYDPNAPGEPGDYPLPPVVGPAFQSPSTPARPVAVLLPLTESSLALVPTLSTAAHEVTTAPVPANPLVAAALDVPRATVAPFVTSDSTVTATVPNNTVALNSFLDLNAGPNARAELALVPPANTDLGAVSHAAFFGNDAPRFADLQRVQGAAASDGVAVPLANARAGLPISADARHTSIGSFAIWSRNAWPKVLCLLGVIGVRVGLGYLLEPDRRKSDMPRSSSGLYGDQARKDGSS